MSSDILKGKNVYLIEDNEFLSSVIIKKLAAAGAHVTHFKNGQDGLTAVRTTTPDLILLDIMMPVMNGYEVLEAMHAEHLIEKSPVIIISNSGQPVEIKRVRDFGVSDYVIKANFTPDEVLEKVRAALEKHLNYSAKAGHATSNTQQKIISPTPSSFTVSETHRPLHKTKILIVEDDSMIQNLLSKKLSKDGFLTKAIEDGTQVLREAENFEPNLIILDLMLPGCDGFEILEQLNKTESLEATPVIVFSNMSEDVSRGRALELGAKSFHIKAMTDLDELITEIYKYTTNS